MKARIFTLALFIIIAISNSACNRGLVCEKGKGELVTQELNLRDITGFDNMISADVILTQGDSQSISVTAQQNILDKLKMNASGGIWKIDFEGCVNYKADVIIEMTLPTLTMVAISGSGNVTATNRFTDLNNVDFDVSGSGNIRMELDAEDITTRVTGSGDVTLDLTADRVTSRVTGSGNFDLSGTCDRHEFRVSGSGDLFAFGLETRESTVKVSGSGNAEVSANDQLDVNISGSGDVRYKGTPAIDLQVSGSGKLVNAN